MAKRKCVTVKSVAWMSLGIIFAGPLSGCAMSDDTMARFLVAPDKYTLYNCRDLAAQEKITAARESELRQLMAQAGIDSSGRLVSAMAYRPDYIEVLGELRELRQALIDKKCAPSPGAADRRMSDTIIR